jgi:hypothetical protein
MGCVVQIWLEREEEDKHKRWPFTIIETDFEDFAAFLEAVDADRLICASRLDTTWGEGKGERVVMRRVPIAFRGRSMQRAELPTWSFVEVKGTIE